MESLVRFLQKSYFILFFIFLEFVAFDLILNNNKEKKRRWLSSANSISAYFIKKTDYVNNYFILKQQNQDLIEAYTRLQNKKKENFKLTTNKFRRFLDSNKVQLYEYLSANVIKNSIALKHNFLTIDAGQNQGVDQGMAVVSSRGVVGIIRNSTKHFSVGLSLLNSDISLSAKLKNDTHFGSVHWNGNSDFILNFNYIPDRVKLNLGDSVVTSGYSFIFPKNIPIGSIIDIKKDISTSFYKLKVKPFVDFSALDNIWIVKNLMHDELKEIQKSSK